MGFNAPKQDSRIAQGPATAFECYHSLSVFLVRETNTQLKKGQVIKRRRLSESPVSTVGLAEQEWLGACWALRMELGGGRWTPGVADGGQALTLKPQAGGRGLLGRRQCGEGGLAMAGSLRQDRKLGSDVIPQQASCSQEGMWHCRGAPSQLPCWELGAS